jgi:hypothetical protein
MPEIVELPTGVFLHRERHRWGRCPVETYGRSDGSAIEEKSIGPFQPARASCSQAIEPFGTPVTRRQSIRAIVSAPFRQRAQPQWLYSVPGQPKIKCAPGVPCCKLLNKSRDADDQRTDLLPALPQNSVTGITYNGAASI